MAVNTLNNTFLAMIVKRADILVALGVIGIIVMMIFPVPTMLLDMLIAFNISLALLVLLMVMYVTEPLQFSVFPGLLLVLTLFRLGLNVASTRMILSDGYAGKIIAAFGNFVVKGNYIVGLIIFLIVKI